MEADKTTESERFQQLLCAATGRCQAAEEAKLKAELEYNEAATQDILDGKPPRVRPAKIAAFEKAFADELRTVDVLTDAHTRAVARERSEALAVLKLAADGVKARAEAVKLLGVALIFEGFCQLGRALGREFTIPALPFRLKDDRFVPLIHDGHMYEDLEALRLQYLAIGGSRAHSDQEIGYIDRTIDAKLQDPTTLLPRLREALAGTGIVP